MRKLLILVGAPGSGKSTHAKTLSGTYVNQDMQGRNHLQLFMEALARGDENIVLDRMNFDRVQRDRYIVPARDEFGYDIVIRTFVVPRAVCMARVLARVGHETIKDPVAANSAINLFFSKYQKPIVSEGKLEWVEYGGGIGEDKPKAIVCDLDGTLAKIDHRLHYVNKKIEGQRPNWGAFFRGIERDEVNQWCADILLTTSHKVVFCSGRPEDHRQATEDWLSKNGLLVGPVFMRSKGDFRSDEIVKENLLDMDILTQYEPVMMIDDRKRVINMWRRRGFICLDCSGEDF